MPAAGTVADLRLAVAQHEIALAIHEHRDRSASRRMGERFGFSQKTWSDYSLGKSWMSRAGFAAAATLLLETRPARPRPGEGTVRPLG